jgi:hypothetical protein
MPTMFNIVSWCNQPAPSYSKLTTFTNDPSITQKMRYSQYVKSTKFKPTRITYPIPYVPPPIPLYTLAAGQVRPTQL